MKDTAGSTAVRVLKSFVQTNFLSQGDQSLGFETNLGKISVSMTIKQEPFEVVDLQPFLDPHRTLGSFEAATSKHMGVSRSLPDWLSAGTDPSLRDTEVRICFHLTR